MPTVMEIAQAAAAGGAACHLELTNCGMSTFRTYQPCHHLNILSARYNFNQIKAKTDEEARVEWTTACQKEVIKPKFQCPSITDKTTIAVIHGHYSTEEQFKAKVLDLGLDRAFMVCTSEDGDPDPRYVPDPVTNVCRNQYCSSRAEATAIADPRIILPFLI